MKPIALVALIMIAYVALAGLCEYIAYQLVMSGHPWFSILAGAFGYFALLCSGDVKLGET